MFNLDYLVYAVIALVLTMSSAFVYKYYNYNNIYYKLYNAKQKAIDLEVTHLTTAKDIYTLLMDYANADTDHNRIIEYSSLSNLRSKRLNDLNKYKDPYNYIIIIQNNLTDWNDVTDTFKNRDIDTIYSTYDPHKMQIYGLKFVNTFYSLTRIY